ncbi:uncharacterized protein LOC112567456 [Pomacea canaliculata]|uniref:uncharacterized protein LOC112567456 n=1 Tax=Pomacea canaliculata TaxID=400727 RepID=UPI000D738561|nr:uncharacterized protein LOC112567456 [Pomacea canaliculata]
MWELYRHNSAPRVVKLTSLHVRYPANVTGLQVNGQEVNQTRVIDEKQEVIVSCFFTNGNPLVSVRLMDDTGRAQSSTTHGQGPLTLSLGQFRCQDVWPTIKCEAPESERNRSVVIFGPPQFLHTDTQVLALRRVLQEGLTLRLRSYTSDIKKCHMTRLSPQPAYIEVTCGLAGSAPEFNLTLRFTADSYIGEGIWMLHAITEAGSSNITFMIINNTSEFGNQGPAMTSGNKKLNTSE